MSAARSTAAHAVAVRARRGRQHGRGNRLADAHDRRARAQVHVAWRSRPRAPSARPGARGRTCASVAALLREAPPAAVAASARRHDRPHDAVADCRAPCRRRPPHLVEHGDHAADVLVPEHQRRRAPSDAPTRCARPSRRRSRARPRRARRPSPRRTPGTAIASCGRPGPSHTMAVGGRREAHVARGDHRRHGRATPRQASIPSRAGSAVTSSITASAPAALERVAVVRAGQHADDETRAGARDRRRRRSWCRRRRRRDATDDACVRSSAAPARGRGPGGRGPRRRATGRRRRARASPSPSRIASRVDRGEAGREHDREARRPAAARASRGAGDSARRPPRRRGRQ